MKRLLKAALRPVWRATAIVRRPIARKIEDWFFLKVEPRARSLSAEIVPGLDGLLRELTRLQDQIDSLQNALVAARAKQRDAERAKAG